MKQYMLDILCCPLCRGDLNLKVFKVQNNEIKEGKLFCSCGQSFPIRNYIAQFVNSDAYLKNFSFYWNKYSAEELYDYEYLESTFWKMTGLKKEALLNKVVLDVGCGNGRYLRLLQNYVGDEGIIIALDRSFAVDICFKHYGLKSNINIIQADILKIPLKDNTVDVLYSLGVLHHTPEPEKYFEALPRLLGENGKISIWVYHNYDKLINFASDATRKITTKIPKRIFFYFCYFLSLIYHLYLLLYKIPLLNKTLAPLLMRCLFISMEKNRRLRLVQNFDWYTSRYQYSYSYFDVFKWFEKAGLTNIKVLELPVSFLGEKSNS